MELRLSGGDIRAKTRVQLNWAVSYYRSITTVTTLKLR